MFVVCQVTISLRSIYSWLESSFHFGRRTRFFTEKKTTYMAMGISIVYPINSPVILRKTTYHIWIYTLCSTSFHPFFDRRYFFPKWKILFDQSHNIEKQRITNEKEWGKRIRYTDALISDPDVETICDIIPYQMFSKRIGAKSWKQKIKKIMIKWRNKYSHTVEIHMVRQLMGKKQQQRVT